MPGFITDFMAFYDETSSLLRYIVKVGDLVKDWEGDLGVIVKIIQPGFPIVRYTQLLDSDGGALMVPTAKDKIEVICEGG